VAPRWNIRPGGRLVTEVSLWSADLANLARDIERLSPYADVFHLDVADAHFAPDLLFFPDLVRALRAHTERPFHVHLMMERPSKMVDRFVEAGADLITVSGHKLGGPKGVGALIRGDARPIEPLIKGGGQERGLRAGTENAAAIAGFGAAAVVAATQADAAHMARLRDRLEAGLKAAAPEAVIFGETAPRLPNTTLFAVPGMKAETAIIAFDLNGIAVSSGSACSSGKVQPSQVLAAMGVEPSLAQGTVRVSLGWSTSDRDVENLLDALTKVVSSLRKRHINSGLAA